MIACLQPSSSLLNAARLPLAAVSCRGMGRRAPKQGKPPILPPSKKVLYHVVHAPWQKPEDVKELLWRRIAYNNTVISLREVFRQELKAKESAGAGMKSMREEEERELDRLLAESEERNEKRRKARATREEEEWKETRNEVLSDIEADLEKKKELAAKNAAKVRDVIGRSDSFVTKENLEKKILEALESPTMYDFAIDRNGKKYVEETGVKYQEGTPTRQKGRLYEKTLGPFTTADAKSAQG